MNRIALIAAASLSCLAASPAMAEGTAIEIYYGDLDTSSEAGLKALNERLALGVAEACTRPEVRSLKVNQAWQQCRQEALEHANEQLAARGVSAHAAG